MIQWLDARYSPLSLGQERAIQTARIAVLIFAVAGGIFISCFGFGYRINADELPLLEHVREHKEEGDVYLLPVELPKLTAGKKGSPSLNFMPPPRRSTQQQNISVDLQQFRLFTGVPIYIDFKSIPYKDVEVLEWHQRLLWNHQLYEQNDWNDEQINGELRRRGITHVVTAADREIRCNALQLVYSDEHFRLYRVRVP
jgi:hypothetical protein